MPYFVRRPYAATARGGTPDAAATDFVALARAALAADPAPPADAAFGPRAPVAAGGQGSVTLDLAADDAGPPAPLRFQPQDLVGPAGRIPAEAVRVTPAALLLAPGTPGTVVVTIAVPRGTAPGRYAGALDVTGDESFPIGLQVEVA